MASPKRVPVPPARGEAAKPPRAHARPAPATPAPPPAPQPRTRPRRGDSLRVLVGGASGMIGRELVRQLEAAGHTVERLVRHDPRAANEHSWSPSSKILDFHLLERVDAVVNLSGAPLTKLPWTASYREEILRSRVKATQALVEAMQMTASAPPVFLSGSAVGFYGDRPGERLDASSAKGDGFLSDVVAEWERAALLAPERTRTVLLRTGVVLGDGGALAPLKLATRFMLGGPVGGGAQHWPWISLHDEAAAIVHLLTADVHGPVDLVGPTPATSGEITKQLADAMHRPHRIPLPRAVLELALRDAAKELLLADQLVVPTGLLESGFAFRHGTSDEAVRAAV